MNEILLIAGSPRSGTTFIGSTLNAHPKISLFSEFSVTDILRSLDQIFVSASAPKTDVPNSSSSSSSSRPFLRPSRQDYDDIFRSIFRSIYPNKSASIFGTKMPAIATKEDIDYLVAHPSKPKVVYVLRNCTSTIASSMKRYEATIQGKDNWLYESEAQALNEWVYSIFIGKYIAERTDTLFVKYEDILINQKKEAEKISAFLGIDPFDFDVSISTRVTKTIQDTLATYPTELLGLVENWDDMSVDEITQKPLSMVRKYLCEDWQNMGITLCDIGTHINFNKPEPWGAWSKAGFFGLKPRFMRTDAALAGVELEFLAKQKQIEHVNLTAFSGSRPLSASIIDQSESTTIVKITVPPSIQVGEDRPAISVFFERWVHSERDPRQLGLPLRRYRLTWNESRS
jgi:Sulfotransferase family